MFFKAGDTPFVNSVGLVAPSRVQIVSPFLLIAIAKSPELTIKILSLLYIGAPRKGESNLFFHFIEPAKLTEKNSPKPVATYKLFLSIAIPPE